MDFLFVRDTVAVALGRMGYRIRKRDDHPAYLVRVAIEALGTMQGLTFVGMPPIQSVVVPFALPELTLYKLQAQSGYARFHLDVFDNLTGAYKGSSPRSSVVHTTISTRPCFTSPGSRPISPRLPSPDYS